MEPLWNINVAVKQRVCSILCLTTVSVGLRRVRVASFKQMASLQWLNWCLEVLTQNEQPVWARSGYCLAAAWWFSITQLLDKIHYCWVYFVSPLISRVFGLNSCLYSLYLKKEEQLYINQQQEKKSQKSKLHMLSSTLNWPEILIFPKREQQHHLVVRIRWKSRVEVEPSSAQHAQMLTSEEAPSI